MKRIIALVGLTALAACSDSHVGDSSFFREAGTWADDAGFGNATMNNHMVMANERGFVQNLSNRFAAEVPNTVNFDFNSAQLDEAARASLRRQADWIKQFPEVRFRVYGHTDRVGGDAFNRRLGQQRANAVVNYLVSQGISRSRLEAVVSFGRTRPVVPTEGPERQNRRTVTEVTGFVRSHKTVMDGRYAEVIQREYVRSAEPRSGLSGLLLNAGGGGGGGG